MDAIEQENRQNPRKTGNTITTQDQSKKEHFVLMAKKLDVDVYKYKSDSESRRLATVMSILLMTSYYEEIVGWEGKAKGLLQVTWERSAKPFFTA